MKAEDIEPFLQSIPDGANPYSYLASVLRPSFFPHETQPRFTEVWKALGILLTISLQVCLLILLGKWREGKEGAKLWRWRETPRGCLFVPNSSVAFTLFSGLADVMAIAYIWLTVRILGSETVEAVAFKAQNNCMAVLWIFLTIAVLSELHALCALFVLASGNSSMSWVAKMNARLFNGIFCALYISVLLSLAIAFGFAEAAWNRLVDAMHRLQQDLLEGAASWDGSSPLRIEDSQSMMSTLQAVSRHTNHFMKGSQAGFSVLLAFTLLTLWLYIPCGIRYSMILSSQIRADHERRHRQAVEIHEEDSVGLTYALMIAKTLLIFLAGVPCCIGAGWAAANLEGVLATPAWYFAVNTLALGGYATLGLLALLVLLYTTWKPVLPRSSLFKSRSSNRNSADYPLDVNVNIETVTFAQHPHLQISKEGGSTKSVV